MTRSANAPARRGWLVPTLIALAGIGLVFIVGMVAFAAGVAAAPAIRAQIDPPPAPPANLEEQLEPLREAWALVEKRYVFTKEIDGQKMAYGAVSGMLNTLNDEGHTRFLTPAEVIDEQSGLAGRFDGIGAEVSVRNGLFTIVAPISDTPAERAGIRAGDIIMSVDDQSIGEWTLTELISHIRGPRGTSVKLQILHQGDTAPTDITIVRDEIKIKMVTWAMVPGTKVAHIKLSQFGETIAAELRVAIGEAKAAGATSLMVDVRNNPGGLLDQAISVGSEFIGDGVLLRQSDRDGNAQTYEARSGGLALDLPMVILTNQGSASASEILAGAVQDRGRGKVIGDKTFGTGTVLSQFQLTDGSALLLGTGQWLTPNGRVIRKLGIQPDIEVKVGFDVVPIIPRDVSALSAEDFQKIPDLQVRRGVEYLQTGK